MKIVTIPILANTVQLAAEHWPDKDAEFFRRWSAPLIAALPFPMPEQELMELIERAVREVRDVPVIGYAVPEVSDFERQRIENAERLAAQAQRQADAEAAIERRSANAPRYAGGGVINLDDADKRYRASKGRR